MPTPLPPILLAAGPSGLWVVGGALLDGPVVLYRYDREGRVQLGQQDFPAGIAAIALGGGYAWLALASEPRVMRMTPAFELEQVARLNAPASELAYGAGHVWASVPEDDGVAKIDPRTKNSITNRVGPRPEQLVVSHHRVLVASNTGHRIVVLSTRTGLPVGKRLPVPPNPYGLGAGEGHVWVTGTGRSTLTRIDF